MLSDSSVRWTWPSLLLTGGLALGCALGDDDHDDTDWPEPPPTVYPLVEGPEPAFQRVAPGETAVFTWRITWPDGARPDHEALGVGVSAYNHVIGALDGDSATRAGWEPGRQVYRLEVDAETRRAEVFPLSVQVCARTTCEDVPAGAARLLVAGGPAEAVFPPVSESVLAVGEVRPFTAWPGTAFTEYAANPNPNFGQRFWSHEPLRFSTDHAGIATVDESGRVEGVAPGETTLRIAAGAAEAQVALTVVEAPLGPPGEGAWPVTTHAVELYQPGWAGGDGPVEAKVAVDSAGWPRFASRFNPGFGAASPAFVADLPPMVLARWTGTGFGYEPLGEPWEMPGQASLAVGGDGTEWALVRGRLFGELNLWERAPGAGIGDWTRHPVPQGPDVGFGEVPMTWFSDGYNHIEQAAQLPTAVWQGPGGEVGFAWATFADFANPHAAQDSQQCPRMLFYASATPGGITVERVSQEWLLTVRTQNGCGDVDHQRYQRLVALPPGPGSPYAGVLALAETYSLFGPQKLALWTWQPGAWARALPLADQALSDSVRDIAPVLPRAEGTSWVYDLDNTEVLWAWSDAEGVVHGEVPEPTPFAAHGGHAATEDFVYAFELRDRTGHAGALWMVGWAR